MGLEFNSNEPIYLQIFNYIKKKILSNELKEGEKLPSVREYASELRVNPNTIQRVYSELENINLIYTQRGVGKFVTSDKKVMAEFRKDMSKEFILRFVKEAKDMGFKKDELIEFISNKYEEV
ncbi:DNA-binding transcriptional regulator YhcF, GntR family [Clostridium cavendishii DSM 21758]|uniref:DNA-binding transcriptional regulator YhcF, GntR family n=1 Tax=Clostridium cavendishii DSM 21758 TaxID=1121302 RepID=A0A1M6I463_9CLOT|nr:GntR family transcriptional regulator [Clostridium cavendishii]SHJ29154.1 DNA-binding transcriptional regulator YhcF, GntR family [Clostridium cavendishii DSM 21758]